MQISILNGIYSSGVDFRTSYPVNLIPVPKANGISGGYLRPAEGLEQLDIELAGPARGSYSWRGASYFVAKEYIYKITGNESNSIVGLTNDDNPVSFAQSFDRLCIASAGKLYYIAGDDIAQVTDPDIGTVNDVVYVDGYFVVTDGEFLIATALNDPTSVNPLSYGSSEIDPDPINQLLVHRNELHAINRYTIEVFANTGGYPFPFARIGGAHIPKGAIGRKCACVFMEAIAFLGSGRGEPPAIYIGENAQTLKISTREIDQILTTFTEEQLATSYVESRVTDGHKLLYVHLPDRTLVYDGAASSIMEQPVWFTLTTSKTGFETYQARYFVWHDGRWLCGNPTAPGIGELKTNHGLHYNEPVRFEFGTMITWAETGSVIVHQLELMALTGNVAEGADPIISSSYTSDGETWSQDRPIKVGKAGDRLKRIVWMSQGMLRNWRAYRFRGTSDAHVSFARLEMSGEPLIP